MFFKTKQKKPVNTKDVFYVEYICKCGKHVPESFYSGNSYRESLFGTGSSICEDCGREASDMKRTILKRKKEI